MWATAHTDSSKWVTYEALFQLGQLPMSDSFHHHVSNTHFLMNNSFWIMGGQKHCFKCALEPWPLSSSLIISSPRSLVSFHPLLFSLVISWHLIQVQTCLTCAHSSLKTTENKTSSLSKQTLSILMKLMAWQSHFCNHKGLYDHCPYELWK